MAETRKLAAILAADVVGFSRLTGADEDRTLARLRALRSDLIDPTIAVHNGRVVKRTGDGALVEFRSVVDAVRCAIEIQNAMVERNAGLPEERRIEFRIGIHLGDIVEESDGDLMGDGVNIAARLEGVAQPGAICLSEDAYRQVRSRLDLSVSDLGKTKLKNIAEPMHVYSLQVGRAAKLSDGKENASAKSLQSKPSLAVLPFANASDDAEQRYFSDGITEDIITELSRFHSLLVIARNSSFQFRGSALNYAEVSEKLGVRYIVSGSIRKLGDKLRITVELTDTVSGSQVWAERYDRNIQEIFDVQDELVRSIVGTLEGRITPSGADVARRKPASSRTAYDLLLQGRDFWNHYDPEAAEEPLRGAIALDPNYATAHAWLSLSLLIQWAGITLDEKMLEAANTHARTAVKLDPNDSLTQWALAHALLFQRQYEEAELHYKRALQLNPNDCLGRACYGHFLQLSGKADEGLEQLMIVQRRDPYPPLWYWEFLGSTYYQLKRYNDAIGAYLKMGKSQYWAHAYRAASYAMLDRMDEARRELSVYFEGSPKIDSFDIWIKTEPYQHRANLDHLFDGLRKAGMTG